MQRRIAHHSALADFAAPDLELRFDQRDQGGARRGQPERYLEHLGQPDETRIADHPVARRIDLRGGEDTRAGLLEYGDAGVLTQLPRQLVGPRIDREHARRAPTEEDIGEPAGRTADVHRGGAHGIEPEVIERMGKLDPAARNPRVVAPADFDRGTGGEQLAGLGDLALARKDQPGQDQSLGAGAAFGQPALGHELVGADLGGFGGIDHCRLARGPRQTLLGVEVAGGVA